MIPLFKLDTINVIKKNIELPFKCEYCGNTFIAQKNQVKKAINNHPRIKLKYCSTTCARKSKNKSVVVYCTNCNKSFNKDFHRVTTNNFCSQSCAATYNNTHKTTGNRRSKLENWLEIQLKNNYPDLDITFNNKTAINSELDIYIPSLKLAFELNGIFHYNPIHGNEKLIQIQNNDNHKLQTCLEHNIELIIINTSHQKYFKEHTSKNFLLMIIEIINKKIWCTMGIEPTDTRATIL